MSQLCPIQTSSELNRDTRKWWYITGDEGRQFWRALFIDGEEWPWRFDSKRDYRRAIECLEAAGILTDEDIAATPDKELQSLSYEHLFW